MRKPIINSSLLEVRSGSNGKWLTTHTGELLLRSGDWEQYVVTSDKFFLKKSSSRRKRRWYEKQHTVLVLACTTRY